MKNYVKPSLEISKFSVEDIMSQSGVIQGKAALESNAAAKNVYDTYVAGGNTAADNVVTFEW